jgi:L-amino acid N-acyltransferase YncA
MHHPDKRISDDVEIVALASADAPQAREIALLRALVWDRAADEDSIQKSAGALAKEIAGADAEVKALLVAKESGVLVGFCRVIRDRKDPSRWWLAGIDVRPANRRRGIGRALVSESIAYARARGCRLFCSETHVDNTASILFHEATGFKNDGPFTASDGDEKVAFSLVLDNPLDLHGESSGEGREQPRDS